MQIVRTTVLCLASIVTLTGCGAPGPASPAAPSELVIGVAAPLTGDVAQVGKMIERGVRLRIDQANAGGGVKGQKLLVLTGDDASNPKEAANVAQRFASNPAVRAVIGHYNSSCSLAGKPIYGEAGVLQITPASTNPAVCVGSKWTFRNIYRDDFQGQLLARYCRTQLGLGRAAVFYDNDDYGIGLKTAFVEEARRIGLEVVAEQSYERDTADFRPQLSTFMPRRPEIIFISGLFSQAAKIASQARESGITVPLLGGDGVFSEEFIRNAGSAAEDTYVATPFLFEVGGEKARKFRDDFKTAHGDEPDAWAVLAYDAAGIVLDAIEKSGPGRTQIRDHVASINSPQTAFEGLSGATYFDAEGDCLKALHMAVVKNGEYVPAPKQFN